MNRRGFLKLLLAGATATAAGVYVPKTIYSFPSEPHGLNFIESDSELFPLKLFERPPITIDMHVKVPGEKGMRHITFIGTRNGHEPKIFLDGEPCRRLETIDGVSRRGRPTRQITAEYMDGRLVKVGRPKPVSEQGRGRTVAYRFDVASLMEEGELTLEFS